MRRRRPKPKNTLLIRGSKKLSNDNFLIPPEISADIAFFTFQENRFTATLTKLDLDIQNTVKQQLNLLELQKELRKIHPFLEKSKATVPQLHAEFTSRIDENKLSIEFKTKQLQTLYKHIEFNQNEKIKITTLKKRLLANVEISSKTIKTVLKEIATHPLLSTDKGRKPKIYSTPEGKQILVFVTREIKCVARDTNSYPLLRTNPPSNIVLAPMKIQISLGDNDMRITPYVRATGKVTTYNNNAAHPHMLDKNIPCLGDFAAPLSEAIYDMEYPTALDILQAFLEQATLTDDAGRSWLNWIVWDTSYIRQSLAFIRDRIYEDDENYYLCNYSVVDGILHKHRLNHKEIDIEGDKLITQICREELPTNAHLYRSLPIYLEKLGVYIGAPHFNHDFTTIMDAHTGDKYPIPEDFFI